MASRLPSSPSGPNMVQLMNANQRQIEIINAGVGGNTSAQLLARVDVDVIAKRPDIVVLMIGTNDIINSGKLTAYEVYKRQLTQLVDQISQSGAKVLLLSPPPVDSTYLFERHDRNLYPFPPDEKLQIARAIVAQLAQDKQLPFVDVYKAFSDAGFPETNKANLMMDEANSGRRDGVHPTPAGYEKIGNLVFQALVNAGWLDSAQRIICFGDSITQGVRVKGDKTATGETYPGVLNALLQNYLSK